MQQGSHDAIIVGGGIGGMAIGALLSCSGWNILILEKNKRIGGRCTSYPYKGFVLDLGNHLFSLGESGPIGKICQIGGMSDSIEWINIRNSSIRVGNTIKKYNRKTMMDMLPLEERGKMEKLLKKAIGLTDEEIEELWYVPLDKWVKNFTDNSSALALIESISSQYFCIPISTTSAGEFIRCFRDTVHNQSSAYPKGGCISIPQAFESIIKQNGGKVIVNTAVEKILIENQKAKGVTTEDGRVFQAPKIISNADIKSTVKVLVGEKHFPQGYVEKINSLTFSYKAVMLKVGLREKITDDQLLMFMPEEFTPILKISTKKSENQDIVGGMIVSPTNYDPDLAATHEQQLISFGAACTLQEDWGLWERVLLNSFYRAYPAAQGKVLWHKVDTPKLVRAYAGEEGNIVGVGQTVDQVYKKRPSVISPIEGLFFSSAEAGGSGIGVELAANSALELFRYLNKS